MNRPDASPISPASFDMSPHVHILTDSSQWRQFIQISMQISKIAYKKRVARARRRLPIVLGARMSREAQRRSHGRPDAVERDRERWSRPTLSGIGQCRRAIVSETGAAANASRRRRGQLMRHRAQRRPKRPCAQIVPTLYRRGTAVPASVRSAELSGAVNRRR